MFMIRFMDSREMAADFCRQLYALEAKFHCLSPTATDNCLKIKNSKELLMIYDIIYGSLADKMLPKKVKDCLYQMDKKPNVHTIVRVITFSRRVFVFYFDLVQEMVLLSIIVGLSSGISFQYWFDVDMINHEHFMMLFFFISIFLPLILFSVHLISSSGEGQLKG